MSGFRTSCATEATIRSFARWRPARPSTFADAHPASSARAVKIPIPDSPSHPATMSMPERWPAARKRKTCSGHITATATSAPRIPYTQAVASAGTSTNTIAMSSSASWRIQKRAA